MTHPLPPPETLAQRKVRQYAALHTIGDLALDLAHDAHAQAKLQIAAPADDRDKAAPDHAATFASMSRAVRQTISIEIRLDAPVRTRPTFRPAAPDPRRLLLRRLFEEAVAADPERRREIKAFIDHHLDTDPDQQIPVAETIGAICDAFDLDLDLSRVSDEILDLIEPPSPPRATLPPARAAP